MKNNAGTGPIQPKDGQNACVLNRASGYSKTMSACDSKTRSPHKGGDMNNKWTKVPGGGTLGGNVKGYGDHG